MSGADAGSPTDAPVLSVVVLSWNTRELTLACTAALAREQPRHRREVIVVDNGSRDGSADAIAAAHADIVLVRNADNRGYAAANNQGARVARGGYVCLLNSDTEVRAGALDGMVDFLAAHADYAAVAPKLVNPDGSVQRACMRFPGLAVAAVYDTWLSHVWPGSWIDDRYFMRDFDHLHSRDVEQPPGACLMLRRDEYLACGGLDESLFLFFNDVDLCRRLWRRGRKIRYLSEAEVMHHQGASTRHFARMPVIWFVNRIAYYRKHYGAFGAAWLRCVLRWRAFEERVRIGRRHRGDPGAVRAARAEVRSYVGEILAKSGVR